MYIPHLPAAGPALRRQGTELGFPACLRGGKPAARASIPMF